MDALINGLFQLIGNLIALALFVLFSIFAIYWLIRIISKWEKILEWFYSLQPHPASDMVRSRVNGGAPLDGELFAAIMRPLPGSQIEQRVRAAQVQELATMARAAAESRLRELEKLKVKAVKEAAFMRAQEDLRSAVEAHELAMARLEALREWRGRDVG